MRLIINMSPWVPRIWIEVWAGTYDRIRRLVNRYVPKIPPFQGGENVIRLTLSWLNRSIFYPGSSAGSTITSGTEGQHRRSVRRGGLQRHPGHSQNFLLEEFPLRSPPPWRSGGPKIGHGRVYEGGGCSGAIPLCCVVWAHDGALSAKVSNSHFFGKILKKNSLNNSQKKSKIGHFFAPNFYTKYVSSFFPISPPCTLYSEYF